jgi:predicted GIY-YIG superfamily endonuclease
MPRKEINYQNTVIYKIKHTEKDDLLYVGHTTDFTKRKNAHKTKCNNPNSSVYNSKLYIMIRENGGWENFKMLEIKKFPCNDHNEACAEEDRMMRHLKANMNAYAAIHDKEKKLLKVKQYREDHKEEISRYRSEIVQCECGCFVTRKTRGKTSHLQSQRHKDGMKTFASTIV